MIFDWNVYDLIQIDEQTWIAYNDEYILWIPSAKQWKISEKCRLLNEKQNVESPWNIHKF